MINMSRRAWMAGAMAGTTLLRVRSAAAQAYPQRAVRIIVPYAPGGGTDVFSRLLAAQMEREFGQTLVIDNRGGGGSTIGTQAVANAQPDGYTIGLYSVASHAIAPTLYAKLPFDADKDFTAVTMLWSLPNLLIVRPGVPAKTVPELIALARANPGKYSFASSGSGTTVHLSG